MLYPPIRPYATRRLQVDGRHELHIEECGSPDGLPVVFLHGGPGAGCEDYQRQFFDPENYRIVLFDQRGAGRSTPHADLTDNTTAHLVDDIEKIREELRIEQWLVFGGSWGSTLGLAYAQTHPKRVLGLILRGIFLCRHRDLLWFYQEGADQIFPDYWQEFLAPIPEAERGDLMQAYTPADRPRRVDVHESIQGMGHLGSALLKPAAQCPGSGSIQRSTHGNQPGAHRMPLFRQPDLHAGKHLLEQAGRLKGIPGMLVHGRYDIVCPIDQAFALHHVWPDSRLDLVAEAGHSALEQGHHHGPDCGNPGNAPTPDRGIG